VLARLSNKRGTPVIALVVVVVVTALLLGTPTHPLDFKFLVLIDVFFSVIVCALTVIAAFVLKRRIPPEEVPFKAPGGRVGHTVMGVLCLFFCVAIVLVNGTDYFLGGYAIMLLIPLFYVLSKRIWKGTSHKEPELYPIDPRTKLGFGDVRRLGAYFLGFGLFGIVGRFFLGMYEADWGPGYEAATAEIGEYEQEVLAEYGHLSYRLDDSTVWIPGYYEQEYERGIFADFDLMLQLILVIGIAAAVLGAVLLLISKRHATAPQR
jgi:amino acid transporter